MLESNVEEESEEHTALETLASLASLRRSSQKQRGEIAQDSHKNSKRRTFNHKNCSFPILNNDEISFSDAPKINGFTPFANFARDCSNESPFVVVKPEPQKLGHFFQNDDFGRHLVAIDPVQFNAVFANDKSQQPRIPSFCTQTERYRHLYKTLSIHQQSRVSDDDVVDDVPRFPRYSSRPLPDLCSRRHRRNRLQRRSSSQMEMGNMMLMNDSGCHRKRMTKTPNVHICSHQLDDVDMNAFDDVTSRTERQCFGGMGAIMRKRSSECHHHCLWGDSMSQLPSMDRTSFHKEHHHLENLDHTTMSTLGVVGGLGGGRPPLEYISPPPPRREVIAIVGNDSSDSQEEEEKSDQHTSFDCKYCSTIFQSSHKFEQHKIAMHSGPKKYVCRCNERFMKRAEYIAHLRAHHGVKQPYACNVRGCTKRFSRYNNLTRHMKTHLGIKPFQCSVRSCLKRFSTKSNLQTHEVTHKGPKRFDCPYCGRYFVRPAYFKKHLDKHIDAVDINLIKAQYPTIFADNAEDDRQLS